MKIHLDKIGAEGLDLDETLSQSWLLEALGPNRDVTATGDGHFKAHLTRIEDVVHVQGHFYAPFQAACSRCLEPVALPIESDLQVAVFPRGSEPGAADDGELGEEDVGVSTYENQEINLGQVVHDEIFLDLPMTPLCSETCAGLCGNCGQNLNQGSCACAPVGDLRWSALGSIKLN